MYQYGYEDMKVHVCSLSPCRVTNASVQEKYNSIFIKNPLIVEYYSWKKYLYFGIKIKKINL